MRPVARARFVARRKFRADFPRQRPVQLRPPGIAVQPRPDPLHLGPVGVAELIRHDVVIPAWRSRRAMSACQAKEKRGVRFIQLYHNNWDSHGGPGENLENDFEKVCKEVDQGSAALVKDLKQRGLLDDTLVVWGGKFGRTPMGENREKTGRNHHVDAFTMWMAGGGIKPGQVVGETDEFGFNP